MRINKINEDLFCLLKSVNPLWSLEVLVAL